MKTGWLKRRLTPAKQASEMYSSLADIIQALFEQVVEPILTRSSNRKSFFTMDDEDLDIKIQELGQFFTIRTSDASSKPMLLQQRLDEIHFKGTSRPITQTFYREFNGIPITWQPLFAPVDTSAYPYGTQLIAENNLESVGDAFGDLFLTSRGVISVSIIDLQKLILLYGATKTTEELTEIALTKFKQVVQPLLPLHIVFDGMQLLLRIQVDEAGDCAWHASTYAETVHQIDDWLDIALPGAIHSEMSPILAIPSTAIPREFPRFDAIPLDGAFLDALYEPGFDRTTDLVARIREAKNTGNLGEVTAIEDPVSCSESLDNITGEQQIEMTGIAEGKELVTEWNRITPRYDRVIHDGEILDTYSDESRENGEGE